jgi:hypothetical protein
MKKIINKIQDLSQKAAQLKQAVESAPAKAAQLRESVLMTAGQLQQLRHDVQSSVSGLRADNEERLVQALREINDHAETFLEAGYELTGVDMELSPTQRLIVHLESRESVSEPTLRSLLSANSGRQTIYALLAALAKADGLAEKVQLSHLDYRKLVVHVGPTPSVRLCWRTEPIHEDAAEPVRPAPLAATVAPTPPALPTFSQSSYFEQRSTPPARPIPTPSATESSSTPTPTVPAAPTSSPAPAPHPGGDWRRSALDRFKKMPDASKYRR